MRRAALVLGLLLMAAPAAAEPLPAQPAAVIDPAPFTHVRSILVPASAEGVTRVKIDAAVMAIARADLADLRVVDAASRQWPYVLRVESGREEVSLRVELLPRDRPYSRHRLVPPVSPSAIDAVTIRVDRPFFDRSYRLVGALPNAIDAPPGRSTILASGRLTRAAGAPEPTVEIAFSRARVTSMDLMVDDGDEAPLPIVSAAAGLPLAELRLVAPPGAYTLMAGDPAAEPPRYEIARLRDRVIGAEAPECALGPLLPSTRHKPPPPRPRDDGDATQLLWAAMGLSVVGLGWLTLRLARKEQKPSAPPPG